MNLIITYLRLKSLSPPTPPPNKTKEGIVCNTFVYKIVYRGQMCLNCKYCKYFDTNGKIAPLLYFDPPFFSFFKLEVIGLQ